MRFVLSGVRPALFALVMALPAAAYAARPLCIEDAGVVDTGHAEAELGFGYVKQTDKEMNLGCVLKYGLVKNTDVGVEIPYHILDAGEEGDVDGLGDLVLSVKYHLWDEGEVLPATALLFEFKTTTGDEDRGLGSGAQAYGLRAALTKEIGVFTVHANAGYAFIGDEDDTLSYGGALEYPVGGRVNLVAEVARETSFNGGFHDEPCHGLVGLNWAVSESARVDFGVGFPISRASPDLSLTTGLTVAF